MRGKQNTWITLARAGSRYKAERELRDYRKNNRGRFRLKKGFFGGYKIQVIGK